MVDLTKLKEWCDLKRLPEPSDFFKMFTTEQGKFADGEGVFWDFKLEWPFSYSDNYWSGIARLICAFANTLGGMIIFGVDDQRRTGGHNAVLVNVDRLSQAFAQLTGARPGFVVRQYDSEACGNVVCLLVPSRSASDLPYRFRQAVGLYDAGTLWVRDGHEVVKAMPQHYPVLFCRTQEGILNEGSSEVGGSLPPSPTTLKKFVGRAEVLDKLFAWLSVSDEPRTFLHGKGGSGKTAIAYEFAKLLKEHGSNRKIYGGYVIDNVVFLSAKEKQLTAATATIDDIQEPDFSSERELYQKILTYGGWTTSADVIAMETPELKKELIEFFELASSLIVIDDVDTLTTKGVDAGFDFVYRTLARCSSGSKVLYTLRNAPSQSLLNSIEVPGLPVGGEYEAFVSACCEQFGVEEPSKQFRDSVLAKESERRPLVIESIIALRRTAGSYKRAVELFEQHAGADVRDYVFSREWDALSEDNLARSLLLAIAELNRPASFAELETILQVDASRITDAIGAVREMFLEIDTVSDETLYSIAQLTRRFVLGKRLALTGSAVIRERVRAFNKYTFTASAAVASLVVSVDRLLPARNILDQDPNRVAQAWSIVRQSTLAPKVTEDPIFRSLRGYVAAMLRPPRLTEAREDFDYATEMNYEPDFYRLKAWLFAEKVVEDLGDRVEHIANIVIDGKRYSRIEKAFMIQRKAGTLFFRGRDRMNTEPTDARKDIAEALKLQLKLFRINVDDGHHWSDATAEYARNTAYTLFDAVMRDRVPSEVVDEMRSIIALKDVYLDPAARPMAECIERLVKASMTPDLGNRARNRLKGFAQEVELGARWSEPAVGEMLVREIKRQEGALKERLASAR